MRVAYDNIRVAPNSVFTQELMARSLEDELIAEDDFEPNGQAELIHGIGKSVSPYRSRVLNMEAMIGRTCPAHSSCQHY